MTVSHPGPGSGMVDQADGDDQAADDAHARRGNRGRRRRPPMRRRHRVLATRSRRLWSRRRRSAPAARPGLPRADLCSGASVSCLLSWSPPRCDDVRRDRRSLPTGLDADAYALYWSRPVAVGAYRSQVHLSVYHVEGPDGLRNVRLACPRRRRSRRGVVDGEAVGDHQHPVGTGDDGRHRPAVVIGHGCDRRPARAQQGIHDRRLLGRGSQDLVPRRTSGRRSRCPARRSPRPRRHQAAGSARRQAGRRARHRPADRRRRRTASARTGSRSPAGGGTGPGSGRRICSVSATAAAAGAAAPGTAPRRAGRRPWPPSAPWSRRRSPRSGRTRAGGRRNRLVLGLERVQRPADGQFVEDLVTARRTGGRSSPAPRRGAAERAAAARRRIRRAPASAGASR